MVNLETAFDSKIFYGFTDRGVFDLVHMLAAFNSRINDPCFVFKKGGQIAAINITVLVDSSRQHGTSVLTIPSRVVRSTTEKRYPKGCSADNHRCFLLDTDRGCCIPFRKLILDTPGSYFMITEKYPFDDMTDQVFNSQMDLLNHGGIRMRHANTMICNLRQTAAVPAKGDGCHRISVGLSALGQCPISELTVVDSGKEPFHPTVCFWQSDIDKRRRTFASVKTFSN